MKTIDQIKKLTSQAEAKIKQAEKQRKLDAIKKEQERKREIVEYAKRSVREFFPEQIEKEAKKGNRTYKIDLGKIEEEIVILQQTLISEHLADFNPVFKDELRTGCDTNWDGDTIDGTEYTYHVIRVYFSW